MTHEARFWAVQGKVVEHLEVGPGGAPEDSLQVSPLDSKESHGRVLFSYVLFPSKFLTGVLGGASGREGSQGNT